MIAIEEMIAIVMIVEEDVVTVTIAEEIIAIGAAIDCCHDCHCHVLLFRRNRCGCMKPFLGFDWAFMEMKMMKNNNNNNNNKDKDYFPYPQLKNDLTLTGRFFIC